MSAFARGIIRPPYSLGSRFKIKDLKELKGKKIASSGAGGRADAFIRFMLAKAGLDPKKDAQIIPLSGGSGIRLAAVVSGNIDATLISPLQGKHAEKLGLTVIPIPPFKYFDLSLIEELRSESR